MPALVEFHASGLYTLTQANIKKNRPYVCKCSLTSLSTVISRRIYLLSAEETDTSKMTPYGEDLSPIGWDDIVIRTIPKTQAEMQSPGLEEHLPMKV